MENFRQNINLLKLAGAKLVSMEVNGKQVNFVAIPVAYNDIFVGTDSNTGEIKSANLSLVGWKCNDKFRASCIENNKDRKDYHAPDAQVSVSYNKEFNDRLQEAAVKNVKADATFMANNPTEDDITKEAKNRVSNRSRVGFAFDMARREETAFTGTPPAAQPMEFNPNAPEDDLPF